MDIVGTTWTFRKDEDCETGDNGKELTQEVQQPEHCGYNMDLTLHVHLVVRVNIGQQTLVPAKSTEPAQLDHHVLQVNSRYLYGAESVQLAHYVVQVNSRHLYLRYKRKLYSLLNIKEYLIFVQFIKYFSFYPLGPL